MSKWPALISAVSFATHLNRRLDHRKSIDNYKKEKLNYTKRRSLRNGQLTFNLSIGAEEGWTIDSNTILHYSQNHHKTSTATPRNRHGSEARFHCRIYRQYLASRLFFRINIIEVNHANHVANPLVNAQQHPTVQIQ